LPGVTRGVDVRLKGPKRAGIGPNGC
jgi:hypothetical protein